MIRASFKGGRKFRSIIPSRKQYSIRLASSKMAELERFAEENNLNAEIVLTIFDDEDNSVLFRESFSVGEGISNNLLFLVSRTLDTTFKDSPQEEKDALLQMLSKAMEEEAVEQECNKKLFSVPNIKLFKSRNKQKDALQDVEAAEAERARQAEEKARQEAAEAERARQAEEKARQEAAEAKRARQAEEKARQEAAEAERARQSEEEARRKAAEAERARQAEEKARQEAAEAERARQSEEEARRKAAEAERARQAEEKARQEAAEAERARQAEEEARRKAAEAERARQAEGIVEENKKGEPAAAVKTYLFNGFSKGIVLLKKLKQHVPDRKNKREIQSPLVAQQSAAMPDFEKKLMMAKFELIEEIKKEKYELDKKLAKEKEKQQRAIDAEKRKQEEYKKALAKRRKRMAAPGLGFSKLILFAILLIIGVQVYFNVESGNSPLTVPGWVLDIGDKLGNLIGEVKKP
ncbi:hypothetical protein [Bacillus subtilis]|uniref:hypothetical protein n=1 Tax=Bacillus subtilis TaxID=1423 RepID=UPI00402579BF